MKTLITLLLFMLPGMAIANTYNAEVVRVKDGDTVLLAVEIWLGVTHQISVRIDGINTGETRKNCKKGDELKRALCRCEKAYGYAAKENMELLLESGRATLINVRQGKFAGRVLGEILNEDGTRVGQHMIDSGLAVPYGGEKRGDWCHPPP